MNRRTFITQATAVSASVIATAATPSTAAVPTAIVDCNAYLGEWPFRHLQGTTPAALATKLHQQGCTQAWVASLDALLHRDITRVNAALAAQCTGPLQPIGSIHPKLPGWPEDLRRCHQQHGMKAIRLHPNYHGYTLDDPQFISLIEAATAQNLLIQIVAQMEDERTQNPLVQVKPVDFKPLTALLQRLPEARVMVLNANRAMSMTALAGSQVWLDIAMLEGVGGVANLLKDWPQDRLVFGSYAPVFYWQSAKLKLQESELSEDQLAAVSHANATRLMA